MDLALWAQLNMVGHVSYSEYMNMTHEEAMACYEALKKVIDDVKAENEQQAVRNKITGSFNALVDHYQRGGSGQPPRGL
mgnify:CR=1 FL=1